MGAIESCETTGCIFCETPFSTVDGRKGPGAFQTLYHTGSQVELAISPLGPLSLQSVGLRAYHTSVSVDGIEYSFSDVGVIAAERFLSHQCLPDGPPQVFNMGFTAYTGKQLMRDLQPFFRSWTYDLLRKNCNSFTDVALFYLLDHRLERGYKGLEKLGADMDSLFSAIQIVSSGEYKPNPKADGFDVEDVIRRLDGVGGEIDSCD